MLDSVQVNGIVRVTAPNVTIRNSYIAGRAGLSWGAPLIYAGTGTSPGLKIEYTEIAPSDRSWIVNGIYGFGFSATAVDVHHVIDAVHIFGNDVSVRASFLHDHYHGPDAGQPDKVTHDDSIQIGKGDNISIVGNSMSGSYNAALQVTQGIGPVSRLAYNGNWTAGGGCTLNIENGATVIPGLIVKDNKFGTSRFGCPILLSPAEMAASAISNNILESSGASISFICREAGKPNWRC